MKKNHNLLKNLTAVLLSLSMLFGAVAFSFAAEQSYKPGDVDSDGKLTAADARWILRASVGLEKYSKDSAVFSAADSDKDGKLTAADARWTLRAAVGLEYLSPTPETAETALLRTYLNDLTKKYGSGIELSVKSSNVYISSESNIIEGMGYSIGGYVEGIVSAYITDFNGDSTPELITARLEKEKYSWNIILSHYIVKNGKVSLERDFYTGKEFENFNDYIRVYLTEKDGSKYINIVDNISALSTSTNQSVNLYTFGVNSNNKTEQLHSFSSFTAGWGRYGYTFDGSTVAGEPGDFPNFDSLLNYAKTELAACGINDFSEETAFDFPSSCQKILNCGTSIEDNTIFIYDHSGYLSGLQTHELSQNDVRKLIKNANDMFRIWVVGNASLDYSNKVTKNGYTYYLVTNSPYNSVEALKNGLAGYFTSNIYERDINEYYITYNGKLYGCELGFGDMSPESIDVSIVSQTENKCVISLLCHYYDYTRLFLISMIKVNEKWVFDNYLYLFYNFE